MEKEEDDDDKKGNYDCDLKYITQLGFNKIYAASVMAYSKHRKFVKVSPGLILGLLEQFVGPYEIAKQVFIYGEIQNANESD